MTPPLTICTVVRNAAEDLTLTLASLDRQADWLCGLPTEVVVVDGESTDASLTIATEWAERCQFTVRLVSQPPLGIYPAMNLAWQKAHGDWLLFMNAGDLLLDAAPIAAALAAATTAHRTSIQFEAALFIPRRSKGVWIPGRHPACHQSLVYRRDLHQRCGPYDERLRICADRLFDQEIRAYGRLLWPSLLAATQVSPANTSRNPGLLRADLATIRAHGWAFRPVRTPWLTLIVLTLEQWIGTSVSVWLRLGLLQLMGRARQVSLG